MRIPKTSKKDKDYITFGIDKKKVNLFRKRYKVGDVLKAKILKVIEEHRAIIDVNGLTLVAYLTQKVLPESEKKYINLEVIRLFPYVQLKQVTSKKSGINLYI